MRCSKIVLNQLNKQWANEQGMVIMSGLASSTTAINIEHFISTTLYQSLFIHIKQVHHSKRRRFISAKGNSVYEVLIGQDH